MPSIRLFAFALACCLFPVLASAMPLKQAAENLLYFEHAALSTGHCERRGFPVRGAYDAWLARNAALHAATLEGIRAHGAKGGLSKVEQDAVLADAIAGQRKLAQEHIDRRGVQCKDFAGVLGMYTSLLRK